MSKKRVIIVFFCVLYLSVVSERKLLFASLYRPVWTASDITRCKGIIYIVGMGESQNESVALDIASKDALLNLSKYAGVRVVKEEVSREERVSASSGIINSYSNIRIDMMILTKAYFSKMELTDKYIETYSDNGNTFYKIFVRYMISDYQFRKAIDRNKAFLNWKKNLKLLLLFNDKQNSFISTVINILNRRDYSVLNKNLSDELIKKFIKNQHLLVDSDFIYEYDFLIIGYIDYKYAGVNTIENLYFMYKTHYNFIVYDCNSNSVVFSCNNIVVYSDICIESAKINVLKHAGVQIGNEIVGMFDRKF